MCAHKQKRVMRTHILRNAKNYANIFNWVISHTNRSFFSQFLLQFPYTNQYSTANAIQIDSRLNRCIFMSIKCTIKEKEREKRVLNKQLPLGNFNWTLWLAYNFINLKLSPCNFTLIQTSRCTNKNCISIKLIAFITFSHRFYAISTLQMDTNSKWRKV